MCVTPSRTLGPHDVSRYFDAVATGFHLREYSVAELDDLFRSVGFVNTRVFIGAKGWFVALPTLPVRLIENIAGKLPRRLRRSPPLRVALKFLLGIRLAGARPLSATNRR